MLTEVHFLLTYACNYECDHCFLYCGPHAEGTFTVAQLREVLDEARKLGVTSVCFEGGEPFLYYPLLVKGLHLAREREMSTGIVTNSYWATAVEDAELWLEQVRDAGLGSLSLSDDIFHNPEGSTQSPASRAATAARRLGLASGAITISEPTVQPPTGDKGAPVVAGGALFKGRAVEKLSDGLPTQSPENFTACEHEELVAPRRVHVDSFGHVQVCQGVSIGNMWSTPLSELMNEYDAATHPICGPLARGGPVALAQEYGIELDGEFVDECHYCFLLRRALIDRYPEYLGPRQVYGVKG